MDASEPSRIRTHSTVFYVNLKGFRSLKRKMYTKGEFSYWVYSSASHIKINSPAFLFLSAESRFFIFKGRSDLLFWLDITYK
jgi:hypothetical protein